MIISRLDRFAMLRLLAPNVRAIMSPPRTPQRDRAPDWVAAGTPPRLRDDLVAISSATRPMRVLIGFSPKWW